MYFKVPARLPLFVEEGIVTARLAERFPGYVPAPLAIEPERGWLLLPEFDELFPWTAPLETRADALRRFAGLQRRSAAEIDELLADGCLDRRLEVLEAQIHPLLHDPVATARFTADETIELRRLEPALEQLCRRLDALGPPATLVHGDLHMLNVARLNGELVYFDWTDACISHPFLDLISLQWEPEETSRAVLLNAYLEGWDGAAEPELLQEAVELAAVVRPLHHAVSYRTIVAGLEESAQGEHATDEFLRELLAQMRARPGRELIDSAGAGAWADARETAEQLRELRDLVLAQGLAEERAQALRVGRANAGEGLGAFRRQLRPGDPSVAVADAVLRQACLIETLQEPGHARRRQHQQADEVGPAQALIVGLREMEQRLEVVDRQPARGQRFGLELASQDRLRTHQAGERLELYGSWF